MSDTDIHSQNNNEIAVLKEKVIRIEKDNERIISELKSSQDRTSKIQTYFTVALIVAGIFGLSGAYIFSTMQSTASKISKMETDIEKIDGRFDQARITQEEKFKKYLNETMKSQVDNNNGQIRIADTIVEWGVVSAVQTTNSDIRTFVIDIKNTYKSKPHLTLSVLPSSNGVTQGSELASIEFLGEKQVAGRIYTQRGDLAKTYNQMSDVFINYIIIGIGK